MFIRNALRSACILGMLAGGAGAAFAQSATVCDTYARDLARKNSAQGQVFGGSIVGGTIGAGLVALTGGSAYAAASVVGGTVGALVGNRSRTKTADQIYQAAYADCMAGRVQ